MNQKTTQDAQVSARDYINMQEEKSFQVSAKSIENFDTETDEMPKLQRVREMPVQHKRKETGRVGSDLNIYNANFEADLQVVRESFQHRKNVDSLFNACGFDELAKHCSLEQIHDICHEYYYGNSEH